MKKILALLAPLALSGCFAAYNPTNDMQQGLRAFDGRDVHTAFDVLGYPDSSTIVDGDTVYSWSISQGAMLSTGSTTLYCHVKIVAGPDKIVKSHSYDGNFGACSHYALKMRALRKR